LGWQSNNRLEIITKAGFPRRAILSAAIRIK
jgi:hypothetical protein